MPDDQRLLLNDALVVHHFVGKNPVSESSGFVVSILCGKIIERFWSPIDIFGDLEVTYFLRYGHLQHKEALFFALLCFHHPESIDCIVKFFSNDQMFGIKRCSLKFSDDKNVYCVISRVGMKYSVYFKDEKVENTTVTKMARALIDDKNASKTMYVGAESLFWGLWLDFSCVVVSPNVVNSCLSGFTRSCMYDLKLRHLVTVVNGDADLFAKGKEWISPVTDKLSKAEKDDMYKSSISVDDVIQLSNDVVAVECEDTKFEGCLKCDWADGLVSFRLHYQLSVFVCRGKVPRFYVIVNRGISRGRLASIIYRVHRRLLMMISWCDQPYDTGESSSDDWDERNDGCEGSFDFEELMHDSPMYADPVESDVT
jgi:hypothetical protein